MLATRLPWLALLAAAPAMAQQLEDPHPDKAYVAVVIGISAYENMPEEVELDFGRSDAATVAGALQQQGRYDRVFLLTDRNATKDAIIETLREKAAQLIGPEDHLLLYFVGHGLGSQFDLSTLLAYDSTVQNGQEDGFLISQFATDIGTWTGAKSTVVITDAIHKNQLDGIYFYGPAADQWPGISPTTMVVSSSMKETPAEDGLFGLAFADGISGAADANADAKVTAGELQEYLKTRLARDKQTPQFAGAYQDDLVLADGVTPGATATGKNEVDQALVYGEHEVYAAKFVFRDGTNPTVECREEPVQPCDSQCYVRNFKAGPCRLSAFVDGKQVQGVTLAMTPGLYDCGVRADQSLACLPPQMPESTKRDRK